jgi:hypothetical protein
VHISRKRVPSNSESKDFPYPYIAISIPFCPIFRRARFPTKHHPPFARYPPHASSHAASHHRRPARITLQHSTRGNRVLIGRVTTPSATPHASLRLPHTRTCHQHVTAWTPTRRSGADYIDDIWSVTSVASQLEHRHPLRVDSST